MTHLALEGLQAERDDLLQTIRSLDEHEWSAASGAPGWRVRDLVAHVAATHHGVVDPSVLPDATGNEGRVEERRAWTVEQVVDELSVFTEKSLQRFAAAQQSERVMTMGAFGTHPASSLADLYLFDLYGHFRADLLAPLGRAEPPRDHSRLRPTIDWMIAALAPMCGNAIARVQAEPFTLSLDGPGGGTWTVVPAADSVSVKSGRDPGSVATVSSTDHDFVLWGSQRRSWRDLAKVDGARDRVAQALDAIRIF